MRTRALILALPVLVLLAPASARADWAPPVTVTPPDGAAYAVPHVAAAGRRALAAWVRAPAGTRGRAEVHVSTRGASATARWSPPRRLSGAGVDAPRVALNRRGDAVVLWVRGRRLVAAVRRGPAGPWTLRPVAEASGGVQSAQVVVDRSGRPTAMWSERSGGGFVVRVATRPSARAGWVVRPPRLTTPGPSPPALALSRVGALVAWVDDGVRAARTAAGAFEPPIRLYADAGSPAAVLSGGGEALAAWNTRLPGGTSVVLAAGRAPGARAWAASDDLGIGLRALAAINDRGDAVVAWGLADPGAPQGIEAATRRGSDRGWRASTVVPRRACECALAPGGVAIDGRGAALVSWHRDEGSAVADGGVAALGVGEASWSRARVPPARLRQAPAVAADAGAGGVAVWAESGPRGGVRAVRLRA